MKNDFDRVRKNVELMASKGAPAEHIDDYLAQEGFTPRTFKARLEGIADAGKLDTAVRYSAGSGVANLLDLPGRTVTAAGNLVRMGAGVAGNKLGMIKASEMPGTIPADQLDVFNPALRKAGVINDDYAPTDVAGRIVDFTTQAVTGGGINPVAVARNAARGAVLPAARDIGAAMLSGAGAGVGSELAGKVNTGNETVDTMARIGGTFLGGMAPGGLAALRGTAGDRSAAAIKGVTKEQLMLADALAKKASESGTPVTAYEAIQSVTGLNPKMQTQQRVVEQSDAAVRGLTPMMQNRPKANSTMFNQAVDTVAPVERLPDTLAGGVQSAAKNAISALRKEGNVAAEPYYAATSNNPANKVPPHTWNMLLSDDGVASVLQTVKKDPFRGLQDAKEGSLQWIDQAKRYLDGLKSEAEMAGNNDRARVLSAARDKLVSAADASFPDYAKARAVVAKNMQENVMPTEMSQVGKLAGVGEHNPHAVLPFKAQSETLLPNDPADVTPSVVERTARIIGEQDPDILKRFVAQDLRRKYAESSQSNMGGENVFGGAKFAANVAGNPTQRENLIAALRASGADTEPFQDAINIFRAQGYKPPVNSATTANANEQGLMSGRRVADVLMGRVRPMVDNWRNGWATSGMAEALAAGPDTVARIEELARANGVHDPMKQQMLINLLLSNQAASPSN